MRLLNSFFYFLVLYFMLHISFAQDQHRIDSLKQLLEVEKTDTSRIDILLKISDSYLGNDPEQAQKYGDKSLELSRSIDSKRHVCESLFAIGIAVDEMGDYERALEIYDRALKIAGEFGYTRTKAFVLNSIGTIHYYKGNYEIAINYFMSSLKTAEKRGYKKLTANCFNNLGNIFSKRENVQDAIEYFNKSREIMKELGNEYAVAVVSINIANIYANKGALDTALTYYIDARDILESVSEKYALAIVIGNIGNIYGDLNNLDKALEYYKKSLHIQEDINEFRGMALSCYNLCAIYREAGNNDKADEYLQRGLILARQVGAKPIIQDIYIEISDIYDSKQDYKNALNYHRLFSGIKDSIFNEESHRQITEMQTKYETEKKEQKIELLNKDKTLQAAELNKQKIIIWSGAGGLLLALSLAFFIYRGYRQKKKANVQLRLKNTTITRQKEEIETKNKDINDSIRYAQSIQQAILPTEAEMSKALPEYFIYFAPRDIVSGDFYWFAEKSFSSVDDNKNIKVYIAACDCTGHGVPGAFVSMIGNDMLNQVIIERSVEKPGEILTELNRGIKSVFTHKGGELEAKDGMDMALCVLTRQTALPAGQAGPSGQTGMTLEFAGANNPLILVQNGELNVIKGDRTSIGGITELDYKFTNHEIELQKGDTIYIFSDGYQDQFGGSKGKKFMIKRFKELLLSIHEKPMVEQREILSSTINDWKGNVEQVDDILVIGVRI